MWQTPDMKLGIFQRPNSNNLKSSEFGSVSLWKSHISSICTIVHKTQSDSSSPPVDNHIWMCRFDWQSGFQSSKKKIFPASNSGFILNSPHIHQKTRIFEAVMLMRFNGHRHLSHNMYHCGTIRCYRNFGTCQAWICDRSTAQVAKYFPGKQDICPKCTQ